MPSQHWVKLKLVYLPAMAIIAGYTPLYSGLRWIFDIRFGPLPLDRETLDFFLPAGLACLLVALLMRKRVRVLDVAGRNDNGHLLYLMLLGFMTSAPALFMQKYLVGHAYGLVQAAGPAELASHGRERFFQVRDVDLVGGESANQFSARTTGRHGDTLEYELYFVREIANGAGHTIWLAADFQRHLNSRDSEETKEAEFDKLFQAANEEIATYASQPIHFFERAFPSRAFDGFMRAARKIRPGAEPDRQIFLKAHKETFENRPRPSFLGVWLSCLFAATIFLLMVLIPRLDDHALMAFWAGKSETDNDLSWLKSVLDPRGPHKATAIIVIILITVYIITGFRGVHWFWPSGHELLDVGGAQRDRVLAGDHWRLLTGMFIHAGIAHLLSNLVALVAGGHIVEAEVGTIRFAVYYVTGGVGAGLVSLIFGGPGVAVGASGAIFAIFGVLLALLLLKELPDLVRPTAWILLVLLGGLSLLAGLFIPRVNNAAHIGGLVSGLFLGVLHIGIRRTFGDPSALRDE